MPEVRIPEIDVLHLGSGTSKSSIKEHHKLRPARLQDPSPETSKSEAKQPKKNKSTLTQTQKTKIKNCVGQCEIQGCTYPPHEVHHIKFLEEGGTDTYSNLIILCGSHHNDAHGKNLTGAVIPKNQLQTLVKKRSPQKTEQIKQILKKKKKNAQTESDKS